MAPNHEPSDSTTSLTAELYYRSDANLGEGPIWADGILTWVDIPGKTILTKPDRSAAATLHHVGLEVGSFALWRDQRLLLATEQGIQAYDFATGRCEAWSNPEPGRPDNRFNDGKCDPRGRFLAGTLNRHGVRGQGALYQISHDRSVRPLFGAVSCSNGLAWTEAGTTLYYIDSPTKTVRAYAYDPETGDVGDSRVVVEIPPDSGLPDGMTIDRTGCLWIGLWDGWAVECWDPATGRRRARIAIPAARVTSCIFGGENLDTLYITTARNGLDQSMLAAQPLAGSVFVARPGVSGYPPVRFAG